MTIPRAIVATSTMRRGDRRKGLITILSKKVPTKPMAKELTTMMIKATIQRGIDPRPARPRIP